MEEWKKFKPQMNRMDADGRDRIRIGEVELLVE
jgi:hypothetical protein